MGKPVNKTLRIAAMSAGEEIGHVSGPIVTFRGNGDPLRSLLVNIDPVQAGTGDPSPDNVRPISGWSAVNVWRTGNNLLPNKTGPRYQDSIYIGQEDGTTYPIHLFAGKTYSLSYEADGTDPTAYYHMSDRVTHAFYSPHTAPRDMNIQLWIYGIGLTSVTNFQLELGPTATPYEPYQGDTYAIQLGQTVYGGTLDVTNGVLTVDRYLYVYDGTESFNKSGTALNGFYNRLSSGGVIPHDWPRMADYYRIPQITDEISSMFKMTRIGDTYRQNYGYCYLDSGMNFNCNPDVFGTTVNSFKVKLAELYESGTPLSVFVKLATPITIPLTPTEISTLQGQNTLWADTGDVDVEYIATGGEGGKLALLLRNRKELLIALRKGLTPAEAGLLNSTPLLGGFVRPGLSTDDEKEEDELI